MVPHPSLESIERGKFGYPFIVPRTSETPRTRQELPFQGRRDFRQAEPTLSESGAISGSQRQSPRLFQQAARRPLQRALNVTTSRRRCGSIKIGGDFEFDIRGSPVTIPDRAVPRIYSGLVQLRTGQLRTEEVWMVHSIVDEFHPTDEFLLGAGPSRVRTGGAW